jgi:cell wall-associated NlpC family hydrolase
MFTVPTIRLPHTQLVVMLFAFLALTLGVPTQVAHAAALPAFTPHLGAAAVRFAAAEKGRPYVSGGAAHARGFDCSGLVTWVYNTRLHRRLPRTAFAQYRASTRVAHKSMRAGDLVFFLNRGRVYHVGIYAGRNQIWHAPRRGSRVRLATLWTTHWVGGRPR